MAYGKGSARKDWMRRAIPMGIGAISPARLSRFLSLQNSIKDFKMDFNLFLSVLAWFGFVIFLFQLVAGFYNYYQYYYNTNIGKLGLALKWATVKGYGIQINLIGFAVCVALLVALG